MNPHSLPVRALSVFLGAQFLNFICLIGQPVEWTGSGDGSAWNDPLNWTPEAVPTQTSEVTIPSGFSEIEVAIPNGSNVITSLDAASSLQLASGSLTINGPATVEGDLTLGNNSTLIVQGAGASMSVTGAIAAGNANVRARDGAVIDFSSLQSLQRSSNGNREWEASGAGSEIILSGLQTLVGRSYFSSATRFLANGGGEVDLSTLPSVDGGTIHFSADGTGSIVDLSALTTFSSYMWNSSAGFTAINEGTLLVPLMTTVSAANLVVDETGNMAIGQIESWNSGTLTIDIPGLSFNGLTQLINVGLNLNGQVPAFPLLSNIDSSSISITDGAVLNLPLVTSYINNANATRTISVTGTGSRLELPNLLTMEGYTYISRNTDILAIDGGVIDLPSMTTVVDGAVWLKADGAGSRIEMPLLQSFNGYFWNTRSGFSAVDGGVLSTPILTSVTEADLSLDASGEMDIEQITTWNTGGITVNIPGLSFSSLTDLVNAQLELPGEVPALPVLANITSSTILASGGAVLNLPLVTEYTNNSNASRVLKAEGAGTRIELPNLVTLQGYSYISRNTDILAVDGGVIDLPSLTTVTDGAIWLQADGTDSRIEMPLLSSFNGYFWNTRSGFSAINGGALSTASLASVTEADLTLDGAGSVDFEQIQTWHTGTITVSIDGVSFNSLTALTNARLVLPGHVPSLPLLSNIDGTSLVVSGGVTLELPLVDSYINNTNASREITATGIDTTIGFPALTNVTGYSYIGDNLVFAAVDGAHLDFPELAEVPGGAVFFRSTGTGSLVDLPRLATFNGYFWNTLSGFEAVNEGMLNLATDISGISVQTATITVNDTATFTVPSIDLLSSATIMGNGLLSGNVQVTEGTINPGGNLGLLTIDGDVTMAETGRLLFEIGGSLPADEHDQLIVNGELTLDGTLETTLVNEFAPVEGNLFILAEWNTSDGAFLEYAGLDAGASTEFVPSIDANQLSVEAQFATGPQVVGVEPEGIVVLELAQFAVTFSEPINRSSFAKEDAVVNGPSGEITVTSIRRVSSNAYEVRFDTQYDEGIYTLELFPTINDSAGNPLNQDGDDINGEPDEDGYTHSVTLSASQLPDLSVSDITAPVSASAGQPVTISWTVANTRENPTSTTWQDAVFIADDASGSNPEWIGTFVSESTLDGNSTVDRSFPIILPADKPGERYVHIVTDYLNEVAELGGELNNATTAIDPINILVPDLTVSAASLNPGTALWGDSVTVIWTVQNVGTAATSAEWTDRIHLIVTSTQQAVATLKTIDSVSALALAPDESAELDTEIILPNPGILADGLYAIRIETNVPRTQMESNRSNNSLNTGNIEISTAPLPDLHVTDIIVPVSVESGSSFTVDWTLNNDGDGDADAPVTTNLFVSKSNSLTGARHVGMLEDSSPLPAGSSRSVSSSFTLPANAPNGNVYLITVVDPDNAFFESNETNNTMPSAETVSVPPRLTLSVDPLSIPENLGDGAATGWITRNGTTSGSLTVALASSDVSELTLPESVIIPSGQSSLSFPISPLEDGVLDGNQSVTLTASAAGFSDGESVVSVIDTDDPGLSLTLESNSLIEGESMTATVAIPTPLSSPTTVFLTASDQTQIVIPSSVPIGAGQTDFTFSVISRQNGAPETDRFLSIQAAADGFLGSEATFSIIDEDLDSLTASLNRSSISEGDGSAAAVLTLTRSPVTSAPVRVHLETPSSRLDVPNSVVIPGGQSSTSVNLNPVDNDTLDGDSVVSITPSVLDPGHGGLVATGNAVELTIQDDDGPTLFLSLSSTLSGEGVAEAAVLTIRRNDGFDTELLVTLASNDPTEVILPASIVIPAGSESVETTLQSVDDGETDGTQTALLSASATGFTGANIEFSVTDADLPDIVLQNLSVQSAAYSENLFSFSYVLANQGRVETPAGFTQNFFLSDDPHIGDDVFLGSATLGSSLPAGESFTRSVSYFAPRQTGQYWIIVMADANSEVPEILETNNSATSASPVEVESAYTATLSTDIDVAPAGTPIPLSGNATYRANGTPAANVIVSLHLKVRNTHRVFAAITDATGHFETTFYPLPTEGGQYTIGASHPGEVDAPNQDTFQLMGILPKPGKGVLELIADDEAGQVEFTLENLADIPLTGLSSMVPDLPEGLTASIAFTSAGNPVDTIPGLDDISLSIEVSATEAAAGSHRILIPITTVEGVTLNLPLDVRVKQLLPKLTADPETLYASLLNGNGKITSFTLSNTGGAPTGPIAISTPATLPWIVPVNGAQLPSIAPGASIEVGFNLNPPEDTPLGEFAGTIAFNASGDTLSLPFNILNLSDATGDLVVFTEDELTYYAEGSPRIIDAGISLRDYFTSELVIEGTTNESGFASFTNITEGYYELEVRAEDHRTYRKTILVEAGIVNTVTAFLPYQSISYNWTVVPTTIEDRYQIVVETVFETNLPIPVVTVEPAHINLDELTEAVTQIDFTLTNQGLLAAENTNFSFTAPTGWRIEPLIEDIGTLPAKSSITVPVIITDLSKVGFFRQLSGSGSCGGGAVNWTVECGGSSKGSSSPVGVSGGGGGGCGGGLGGGGSAGGGGGGGSVSINGAGGDCTSDGDDPDTCVPKTLLLCGVGMIPVPGACAPGVLDCMVSFDDNKPITSTGGCILAGVGCIPGLNVPANLLLCAGSLILCASEEGEGTTYYANLSGTIAGGDALQSFAAGNIPMESEDDLTLLGAYTDMCEQVYDFYQLIFGTEIWFNGLMGPDFTNWNIRLQDATAASSEEGSLLSDSEMDNLMTGTMPESITPGQVAEFLQRYQRGLEYAEMGILYSADLPDGMDSDFLPLGELRDAAILAQAAYEIAATDGFADPWEGLIHYRDRTIATLGTKRAPAAAPSTRDGKKRLATTSPRATAAPRADGGGVCARVRLRIEQEAVLARDAFDARLEIINETDLFMDGIGVSITISDESGADMTHLFQIREPKISGLTGVDGDGFLPLGDTGKSQWIIVPTPDAAPTVETRYFVSGSLRYLYDGVPVNVPLEKASINVLPTPRLSLKYFHQRDVFSDDPFTDVVEPSIPFSLGIIVENNGAGTAREFTITSSQPKIVDNEKGLLVDFQIVATQVDGKPLLPSLKADFGDIPPGGRSVAQWLMTSSIQGLFIEYEATFEHVDAFGDPRLSLIDSVEIMEMIRPVQGDDDLLTDFLVNEFPDDDDFPDSLYLGNGEVFRVSVSADANPERAPSENSLTIGLTADMPSGWSYLRIPDPSDGAFILTAIKRSDDSSLPADNFWQTDRTFIGQGMPPIRENMLHLLDKDSDGQYTLVYVLPPEADIEPPASNVITLPSDSSSQFSVSWQGNDNSDVRDYSLFVSTDNGPFVPWLRNTTLKQALFNGDIGSTYAFYSVARDHAGNMEAAPSTADASTTVSITNSAPVISPLSDIELTEGEFLEMTISASDPDEDSIQFALKGDYPTGMSIDSVSGLLTWQSGETHGGLSSTIQFVVSDNESPAAQSTGSFNLTVTEANIAPFIQPLWPRVVDIGSTLSTRVIAQDDDLPQQTLEFALGAQSPDGTSIDPQSGLFTWTPTMQDIGNYDITVLVSDGVDEASLILPVDVTLPEQYNDWKNLYWQGLNDLTTIGFDADPDGDGIHNLAEYALGLNPTLSNEYDSPWVELISEGTTLSTFSFFDPVFHLRVGFVRRVDDPRLRVELVASSDLGAPDQDWEELDDLIFSSDTNLPLGFSEFIFRDSSDSSSFNQRFIRLRYTYE